MAFTARLSKRFYDRLGEDIVKELLESNVRMSRPYLEITFRKGRALAAYLYLPTPKRERSVRTRRFAPGLVVDLSRDGRPLGVEITAPGRVTLGAINRALRTVGAAPVTSSELAPLHAA